ncbi:MAG: hypothetical protein JXA90_05460, partial [Planctomycetes bacterium]|nr:hypothetical protein [Planctomycetota bacterium]
MDEPQRQIDLFREVLRTRDYRGYEVIVVSSSTADEALHQQELLERALGPLRSPAPELGGRVLVLSVVDPTEGGQLIGQVYTWKEAARAARRQGIDLDRLLEERRIRVAVYHNGGKGERASPLTQGLGNSRGAQRLVGDLETADGQTLEQELLLSVVVQTSALAVTCEPGSVDTFWTSQLMFSDRPPGELPRSGAPIEKYIVAADRRRITARQLHDFGTALLAPDGIIRRFFGNKQFARCGRSGEWEIIEERRAEWDVPGYDFGFDFGSYRARGDLHRAMVEFYDRPHLWEQVEREGRIDSSQARDIDPHFTQPLAALLEGIAELREVPASLPPPADLRQRAAGAPAAERAAILDSAVGALRSALPSASRTALDRCSPRGARDVLEFFVLYRDRPFLGDPSRVIGSIRFGAGSLWITFRRPIDIANDKLALLAGLTEAVPELAPDNSFARRAPDAERIRWADDGRRLRGIGVEAAARFRVGDRECSLNGDEVFRGCDVAGVFVKGSLIRGRTRLLPGSRIIDSVLNHVEGEIHAECCYLEGVTARRVSA